jgi:hypothetical protein
MRARARNSAPAIRTASSESEMPKPAVSLGLSELTSPRIHRFVVSSRQPFFGLLEWGLVSGAVGRCEFIRLPLSEDGELVTQILAMEDYDFPQLDALPSRGEAPR